MACAVTMPLAQLSKIHPDKLAQSAYKLSLCWCFLRLRVISPINHVFFNSIPNRCNQGMFYTWILSSLELSWK